MRYAEASSGREIRVLNGKRVVRVAVIAGIVLLSGLWWWTSTSPSEVPAGGVRKEAARAEQTPQTKTDASRVLVIPSPTLTPAPITVPRQAARLERISPIREYERADRLPVLVRRLMQDSSGEAAFAVYLAAEECGFLRYRNAPAWLGSGHLNNPAFRARRDAYLRRLGRCEGMQDIPEVWEKPELFRDIAAEAGFVPAQASTMNQLRLAGRTAEAEAIAISVISGIDGNSVLPLYPYIVGRAGGPIVGDPPQVFDRPVFEAAWIMSACELGLNCAADSQVLQTICISTGRCGYQSYDEFAHQFLNQSGYEQSFALRGQIVDALRNGRLAFFGIRPKAN